MGSTQKVLMFKRTPRNPKKKKYITHSYCEKNNKKHFFKSISELTFSSKSVYDFKGKNNLSICNMVAS
jgi:hypothetical protein